MNKIDFYQISCYITNVCNLNCDNCLYFNNYAFSGHQRWHDYQDMYKQWSQRLDIECIHILGGEPMSNPDFLKWVHGMAELWPRAMIKICTNGTMLDRWPNLYQEILPYQGRVYMVLSGHNPNEKQNQITDIKKFLRGSVKTFSGSDLMFEKYYWNRHYQAIKDPTWPECNSIQDYHNLNAGIKNEIENVFKINVKDFLKRPEPYPDGLTMIDENHVRVGWSRWWKFTPAAVIHSKTDNTLSLHQSDPEQAMAACGISLCHQFSKGKLYKCPVSMNLSDFIQQFPVDLSDDDKNTIMNYRAAQADWNDNDLLDFVQGLKNKDVIALCKFCTSNVSRELIYAGKKKIKIKKLSNQSPDTVIS